MREIRIMAAAYFVVFAVFIFEALVAKAEVIQIENVTTGEEWNYHIERLGVYPTLTGCENSQNIRLVGDGTNWSGLMVEIILQSVWGSRTTSVSSSKLARAEPGITPSAEKIH